MDGMGIWLPCFDGITMESIFKIWNNISGWWFQPLSKIWVKMGNLPQISGWKLKNHWKHHLEYIKTSFKYTSSTFNPGQSYPPTWEERPIFEITNQIFMTSSQRRIHSLRSWTTCSAWPCRATLEPGTLTGQPGFLDLDHGFMIYSCYTHIYANIFININMIHIWSKLWNMNLVTNKKSNE